jgi:glycyl-tRNA synthetase
MAATPKTPTGCRCTHSFGHPQARPGKRKSTWTAGAIGIDRTQHDIRFVEDNWESPALGSWGLGWQVWCDGQEISQFTYFQQAGGQVLDPIPVELTYGLERIVLVLQDRRSVWDIEWGGGHAYSDVLKTPEVEHCVYDFETADVQRLTDMYKLPESAASQPRAAPGHRRTITCCGDHTLMRLRRRRDERAGYFAKMRDPRQVAAYVAQREREAILLAGGARSVEQKPTLGS